MWLDLGLAELWVVCLDKNTNKNRVKRNRRNRPWRPASSYGRYGAPLPAIKHTTINYYSILWVGIVKSRKKTLIITVNMTISARRVDDDVRL